MKQRLILLAAALSGFAALHPAAEAATATSYLLVQGPFGTDSATETYKWKVIYDSANVTSSQDLFNLVFGAPVATGSQVVTAFGTYDGWSSSQGNLQADYVFSFGSLMLHSLTINGTTIAATESEYWNFNVAGGSGLYGGDYAQEAWSYSFDSAASRLVADGSFDAWGFGATDPDTFEFYIDGALNLPLELYFADAVVVNAVPEPGTLMLGFVGLSGAFLYRRRLGPGRSKSAA